MVVRTVYLFRLLREIETIFGFVKSNHSHVLLITRVLIFGQLHKQCVKAQICRTLPMFYKELLTGEVLTEVTYRRGFPALVLMGSVTARYIRLIARVPEETCRNESIHSEQDRLVIIAFMY